MNIKSKISLSVLALCAAGAANAAVLDIEYQGTHGIKITMANAGAPIRDYLTGAMQYTVENAGSFEAFCIELSQMHSVAGYKEYTQGSFGATQANLLQGLFSSSYASLSTDNDRAAFQTAIWEITHETSGTLNAGAGTYRFGSITGGTADQKTAFLTKVNSFLTAAANYHDQPKYLLTKLESATYQDLLTVTAVPEPESYAMLLAGLGVVGFVARRRRRD